MIRSVDLLPRDFAIPPIVRRELLVAFRKSNPQKRRWRFTWIGIGISVLFMIAHELGASFSFARTLLNWLFYVGLYVAVPETLQLTAGMFSQERQNRTFGFLFLAGLTMPEIFLSKIAGSLLITSADLLALAPFVAIPFLGGGLSLSLFSATICCLPVLMLLVLALATLGSVLSKDENAALFAAIGIGAALCLFTPGIYWIKGLSGHRVSTQWLEFSPAYGPSLILGGLVSRTGAEFWRNCQFTILLTLLLFLAAALLLRQKWREETGFVPSSRWSIRLQNLWRGGAARRSRLAQWLGVNPFVWLAAHDVAPERLGWLVLSAIVAVWCLGLALVGRYWLAVPIGLFTATILDFAFDSLYTYTAAKSIAAHRRDSGIELLLTTPLEVTQIVEGQFNALRFQFRPLLIGVLCTHAALALFAFLSRSWTWSAILVYLFIWAALAIFPIRRLRLAPWREIWIGLNSGRVFYSGAKGRWRWFWIAYNIQNVLRHGFSLGSNTFPTGSLPEVAIVIVIGIIVFFATLDRTRTEAFCVRLLRDFRSIAEEPLPEANDPRFKNWEVEQRFPAAYPHSPTR